MHGDRIRIQIPPVENMLLKALRNGVGLVVVGLDRLTRPKPIHRTPEEQTKAQRAMEGLSLYQLNACPFCIKTRRALHRLNLEVEIKDIGKNKQFRKQLQAEGGRVQVPCLLIEKQDKTEWLYESEDIVSYLEQRIV